MLMDITRDIDVRVTRCMLRAYKAGTRCFVHVSHVQFILERGAGRISAHQPNVAI
jgi:hypothetical protein